MEFKEQSELLKELLGLKKEPLAITFTNDEIADGQYEKTSICKALKRAAEGNCFVIDEEVSTCPGGRRWPAWPSDTPRMKRQRMCDFGNPAEILFFLLKACIPVRQKTTARQFGSILAFHAVPPLRRAT